MDTISWSDFQKIDIRVGRITSALPFPEARNPSYRLLIDLGEEIGQKKSCAQVTQYSAAELVGKLVLCVVNFPPKQIATAISEVLVLGLPDQDQKVSLLTVDYEVPLGGRVY